jgi:hypothetical protein
MKRLQASYDKRVNDSAASNNRYPRLSRHALLPGEKSIVSETFRLKRRETNVQQSIQILGRLIDLVEGV